MNKMTIVITMAGVGSRFRNAGYTVPKYEINVNGKSLFEWSLDSLKGYKDHVEKIIFVVRQEDNAQNFIKSKCTVYGYSNIKILEIDYITDGQATTALLGINECNPNSPILIYNIDTYIEPYQLKFVDLIGDGHIPCFCADGTHWSFVRLNDKNEVVEVREKQRISDNCSLGAYYFASATLYKHIYEQYYKDDTKIESNEKYIAPMYNYMIEKGYNVTMSIIDRTKVHVLGTPEEVDAFNELYKNI